MLPKASRYKVFEKLSWYKVFLKPSWYKVVLKSSLYKVFLKKSWYKIFLKQYWYKVYMKPSGSVRVCQKWWKRIGSILGDGHRLKWGLEKPTSKYPMAAMLEWHQNHRYLSSFITVWILVPFLLFWFLKFILLN